MDDGWLLVISFGGTKGKFDFKSIITEEVEKIELIVNKLIRKNVKKEI